MAVKKTPGPIMQKVRSRITRTKAEAKAKTAGAATAVKKQVSGVREAAREISDARKAKVEAKKAGKRDFTTSYNVGEAFQQVNLRFSIVVDLMLLLVVHE